MPPPPTPVAHSPNRAGDHPVPNPSVIATIQQEQAKCFADQAALSLQMQNFFAQFGPVITQLQSAAAQADAARVPVDVATPPKKAAYVPPPAGQRTLAQTVGATARSSSVVSTHRGPGAVRRSPSRTRSAPYDTGAEEHNGDYVARSRSPVEEPSRPSGAVINLDEEREAARRANFQGGTVQEPAVPPPLGSRPPDAQ